MIGSPDARLRWTPYAHVEIVRGQGAVGILEDAMPAGRATGRSMDTSPTSMAEQGCRAACPGRSPRRKSSTSTWTLSQPGTVPRGELSPHGGGAASARRAGSLATCLGLRGRSPDGRSLPFLVFHDERPLDRGSQVDLVRARQSGQPALGPVFDPTVIRNMIADVSRRRSRSVGSTNSLRDRSNRRDCMA